MPKTSTSFGEKAGNPRNTTKPGPGRPDLAVRIRAQTSWAARIPRLEKIADGKVKDGSVADSISAMRELRSVGFAEQVEHGGSVEVKHQVWKFGDKEVAF